MASLAEPSLMESGTAVEPLPITTTTTSVGRFSGVVDLLAIRPAASLYRFWTNYYPRVAYGEVGLIMPGSALTFIIDRLLNFVAIKSQGQPGFPFQTNPNATMMAVTCLLMYGLASGAEHAISASQPGPNSIYSIIARWGKMVCVYMMNHRSIREIDNMAASILCRISNFY